MTDMILARHGQTAWNLAEVFRGRIDVELDETGLQQAEMLGSYLSRRKLAAVYSSPLKRAMKTAGAIAGHHGLDVKVALDLVDIDFGEWQGLARQEVESRYGERYTEWMVSPHTVRMPSGESLDDVRQRAMRVVTEVIAGHEDTVVLASHRVVCKVLICALLSLDNSHFWDIRLDTCGMTTFVRQDGRWILAEHNNTSFLESLEGERLNDF